MTVGVARGVEPRDDLESPLGRELLYCSAHLAEADDGEPNRGAGHAAPPAGEPKNAACKRCIIEWT